MDMLVGEDVVVVVGCTLYEKRPVRKCQSPKSGTNNNRTCGLIRWTRDIGTSFIVWCLQVWWLIVEKAGVPRDSRCVIRRREKWLIRRELRTSNMLPSLIGSQCDRIGSYWWVIEKAAWMVGMTLYICLERPFGRKSQMGRPPKGGHQILASVHRQAFSGG
jgi:hypothetical protein